MKKQWAAMKPGIQQKLQENPSLGVLIIVRFGRREKQGGEHETPLGHTARFLSIDTEYASTESEGWEACIKQPRQRDETGLTITHRRTFIEPKNPVYNRSIRTPFTSYGIGTFVTGRARLMRVAWKGLYGFDEITDVKLDVPGGVTPRFLRLVAPNEIEWFNGRVRHTTRVPVDWQDAGQSGAARFFHEHQYVAMGAAREYPCRPEVHGGHHDHNAEARSIRAEGASVETVNRPHREPRSGAPADRHQPRDVRRAYGTPQRRSHLARALCSSGLRAPAEAATRDDAQCLDLAQTGDQ